MIVRYYDASKNADGAFFPGVPLRDIEDYEWDALSTRMQESIDAAPFYVKTKPRTETAPLKGPKE
jgi:hypothetical protein